MATYPSRLTFSLLIGQVMVLQVVAMMILRRYRMLFSVLRGFMCHSLLNLLLFVLRPYLISLSCDVERYSDTKQMDVLLVSTEATYLYNLE